MERKKGWGSHFLSLSVRNEKKQRENSLTYIKDHPWMCPVFSGGIYTSPLSNLTQAAENDAFHNVLTWTFKQALFHDTFLQHSFTTPIVVWSWDTSWYTVYSDELGSLRFILFIWRYPYEFWSLFWGYVGTPTSKWMTSRSWLWPFSDSYKWPLEISKCP